MNNCSMKHSTLSTFFPAGWVAKDIGGGWFWYKCKPELSPDGTWETGALIRGIGWLNISFPDVSFENSLIEIEVIEPFKFATDSAPTHQPQPGQWWECTGSEKTDFNYRILYCTDGVNGKPVFHDHDGTADYIDDMPESWGTLVQPLPDCDSFAYQLEASEDEEPVENISKPEQTTFEKVRSKFAKALNVESKRTYEAPYICSNCGNNFTKTHEFSSEADSRAECPTCGTWRGQLSCRRA